MKLFVGDTRSRALLAAIATRDEQRRLLTGQLVQRGRMAAWLRERQLGRRTWVWAYDNAAYQDWREGKPFDSGAFAEDIAQIAELPRQHKPLWLVLPDVVSGGERSLALSLSWLDRLPGHLGVPVLVALQEGLDPSAVPARDQLRVDGWFIGGATWAWKVRAAAAAVAWCNDARNPSRGDQFVHVGRAGSASRIWSCRTLGVESCDSNAPLWSKDAWRLALAALRAPLPLDLPGLTPTPIEDPPKRGDFWWHGGGEPERWDLSTGPTRPTKGE